MRNIVVLKNTLEKNIDLKSNLDLLVNYSLANKILSFNQCIIGIDFNKLLASQLIELKDHKYHIIDFELFAFSVYSLNKIKSKITLSNDFKTFVLLLNEIESLYESDGFIQGITSLLSELWRIAILDSNKSFDNDFTDYLNSLDLDTNRQEVFSFCDGYSQALPLINIDVQEFFKNGILLIRLLESDADYNMPLIKLFGGIKSRIKKDEEFGQYCFDYSIKQSDLDSNLIIPIISGLYERQGVAFYRSSLEAIVTLETYSIPIICGLSNIDNIKDEDCLLFFEIFNQFNQDNTDVLLHLPKLLFGILRSSDTSVDKKHIKNAFIFLNELLEIDNENLIFFILRESQFTQNHLKLRKDLIVNFIKKPHFKQEYVKLFDYFLLNLKDASYFEKILYSLGEHLPFKSVSDNLSSTIYQFKTNCKKEFDRVIVNLLIQDNARYRFIGADIFTHLSSVYYQFDYDILELNSLDQYKLMVSIFQSYREPKSILPCVLVLLKSKSRLVKELFICKLEEYTESYGGGVTSIIKKELNFEDLDMKTIFERVEKYKDDFYRKNILVKKEVKELNPVFSQNKLFEDYYKKHNRYLSREMQKGTGDRTLFLNLGKVTLLKGGGWKINGQNEISKLSTVTKGFSLPRDYFTRPENFDFECTKEMTTSWNEAYFAEIKRFLDNE